MKFYQWQRGGFNMSHKVDSSISHSKGMQHLVDGNTLNVKGYSHVVCVRQDKKEAWLKKGYEVINESADALIVGKKKLSQEQKESKKQTANV